MESAITAVSLALAALWILWVCLALALYQKIDARFSGLLPPLRNRLQPLTDWATSWAFIQFLCRRKPSTIDNQAVLRDISILRWLAVPGLLLWGCAIYLQLHGQRA